MSAPPLAFFVGSRDFRSGVNGSLVRCRVSPVNYKEPVYLFVSKAPHELGRLTTSNLVITLPREPLDDGLPRPEATCRATRQGSRRRRFVCACLVGPYLYV